MLQWICNDFLGVGRWSRLEHQQCPTKETVAWDGGCLLWPELEESNVENGILKKVAQQLLISICDGSEVLFKTRAGGERDTCGPSPEYRHMISVGECLQY